MDLEYSMYTGVGETGEKSFRKKLDEQIFGLLKKSEKNSKIDKNLFRLILISLGTIPKEIDYSKFLDKNE